MNYTKAFIYALFFFIAITSASAQFTKTIVSLTGNILDEVSKKPVSVKIYAFDVNGKNVAKARSNSSTGEYFLTGLQPGQTYNIEFRSNYYFLQRIKVDIPNTDKYAELSKDFIVTPMEKDVKIALSVPPFELNKSKLRYGSELFLDDYAELLKTNPGVEFRIDCYPDVNASSTENAELTKQRAESLAAFFQSKGISASRILAEGHSTVDPNNPPPVKKSAKGKRYIGSTYITLTKVPEKPSEEQ